MAPPYESAVFVSGVGACTCLGGAIPGAAAARAGIRRSSEFDGLGYVDEATNDEVPLIGHSIKGVTEGFQGIGRLIRLGASGLQDLQANAPGLKPAHTGFFLSVPRLKAIVVEEDDNDGAAITFRSKRPLSAAALGMGDDVLAGIVDSVFGRETPKSSAVFMEGRHGALLALQAALTALRQGHCEAAVVGACDSALDEDRLTNSLGAGRLKTEENPVGFMPGEASAFLLLESRKSSVSRAGTRPMVIGDPAFDIEENSFVVGGTSMGRGTSQVAASVLGRLGMPAFSGCVFIDINGEPYRSSDWAHAAVRLRAQGLLPNWSEEVSALSFGETGVAGPILALVLAVRAFSRGYAAGNTSLVLCSDDDGHRGAVTLQQVQSTTQ